ncbi:MAG: hypothetical protein ACR2FG_15350 [Marmoricola sp.]
MLAPKGELLEAVGPEASPSDYLHVSSYAVLPNLPAARQLLPMDSRRAAGSSFRVRFAGQRRPIKAVSYGLLARSLTAGAARVLPLDRVEVLQLRGLPREELPQLLLADYLSEVLGTRVLLGAAAGARDAHQTVSMHALTGDGEPVGFVKVAWNDLTRRLLRDESRTLQQLATSPRLLLVRPPHVRHHATWGEFELLVTDPLPIRRRRRSSSGRPEVAAALEIARSGRTQRVPIFESTYWQRTLHRVNTLRPHVEPRARETLDRAVFRFGTTDHQTVTDFGPWHGDCLPWNYSMQDGQLLAWDWEYASDAAPVGFDILHFYFGTSFFRDHRDGGSALRAAEQSGIPVLTSIGLDHPTARLHAGMYLLEMLLRRLDIVVHGGGADDARFFPHVYDALEQSLGTAAVDPR